MRGLKWNIILLTTISVDPFKNLKENGRKNQQNNKTKTIIIIIEAGKRALLDSCKLEKVFNNYFSELYKTFAYKIVYIEFGKKILRSNKTILLLTTVEYEL